MAYIVHQSFKAQIALDADLRDLINELRDTLAQVQYCRNSIAVPGASKTVQNVICLVLHSASLIDEWLHTPSLSKQCTLYYCGLCSYVSFRKALQGCLIESTDQGMYRQARRVAEPDDALFWRSAHC